MAFPPLQQELDRDHDVAPEQIDQQVLRDIGIQLRALGDNLDQLYIQHPMNMAEVLAMQQQEDQRRGMFYRPALWQNLFRNYGDDVLFVIRTLVASQAHFYH